MHGPQAGAHKKLDPDSCARGVQGGSAGSGGDLGWVWIRRLCKSDLNQRCYGRSQGWTALMIAAENGHRDCAAELLAAGVDKVGGPRSRQSHPGSLQRVV